MELLVNKESDYAYGFGAVSVLETKLITKDRFERMAEAKTLDDIFKMLAETGYRDLIEEFPGIENLELLLNADLKRAYKLLAKMVPETERKYIDLFYLEYDFHNFKLLIKSKFHAGKEEDALKNFIDLGTVGKKKFSELIKADISQIAVQLPEYADAVLKVKEEYERTKDARVIDAFFDKALFDLMAQNAVGSELILEIVNIYADIANLKTYIRAKELNREKEFIVFIPYGKISIAIYEKGFEDVIKEFSRGYEKIILPALDYHERERSWAMLEKLADEFVIEKLKSRKFQIGIEPLIGYLIAKKMEVKMLRAIIISKLGNIPAEHIRGLWRMQYAYS